MTFDIWHASIATVGNTHTDYVTYCARVRYIERRRRHDIYYRNRIRADACTHLRLREQYACAICVQYQRSPIKARVIKGVNAPHRHTPDWHKDHSRIKPKMFLILFRNLSLSIFFLFNFFLRLKILINF